VFWKQWTNKTVVSRCCDTTPWYTGCPHELNHFYLPVNLVVVDQERSRKLLKASRQVPQKLFPMERICACRGKVVFFSAAWEKRISLLQANILTWLSDVPMRRANWVSQSNSAHWMPNSAVQWCTYPSYNTWLQQSAIIYFSTWCNV